MSKSDYLLSDPLSSTTRINLDADDDIFQEYFQVKYYFEKVINIGSPALPPEQPSNNKSEEKRINLIIEPKDEDKSPQKIKRPRGRRGGRRRTERRNKQQLKHIAKLTEFIAKVTENIAILERITELDEIIAEYKRQIILLNNSRDQIFSQMLSYILESKETNNIDLPALPHEQAVYLEDIEKNIWRQRLFKPVRNGALLEPPKPVRNGALLELPKSGLRY